MERASEALTGTRYFECEALCVEALAIAHSTQDYERMARILLPLQEARRQKRQLAQDAGKVRRLSSPEEIEPLLNESKRIEAGFYLIEPPLVGADGRELREKANAAEVPVCIVVREPETQTGQWPVVMVGPVTVRTRVSPAGKKVAVRWMLEAGEALGDRAIASVDAGLCAADRVERLYELLATVVDHEKLHQALERACLEAMHEPALSNGKSRPAATAEGGSDEGSGD